MSLWSGPLVNQTWQNGSFTVKWQTNWTCRKGWLSKLKLGFRCSISRKVEFSIDKYLQVQKRLTFLYVYYVDIVYRTWQSPALVVFLIEVGQFCYAQDAPLRCSCDSTGWTWMAQFCECHRNAGPNLRDIISTHVASHNCSLKRPIMSHVLGSDGVMC